jgi:hypothetical protein
MTFIKKFEAPAESSYLCVTENSKKIKNYFNTDLLLVSFNGS